MNTLLAALVLAVSQMLAQSVDKRLSGAEDGSFGRFLAYPGNAARDEFKPNPKFWAAGVDFSCASPWNDAGGVHRAGTLISKRHVVMAKHFPMWKGVRISFVDNMGNVCPGRIAGTRAIEGTDILVASLDYEVTPNIHPAKILPTDYAKYIGDGAGLPVVTFNQREELVITELKGIPTNRLMKIKAKIPIPEHMHTRYIEDGPRTKYRKLLVGGDSGNPAFLIAGDEPILLYCDVTANASSGPPLHLYRREIQKAMDELCPGYKLEAFDFSKVRCGDGTARGSSMYCVKGENEKALLGSGL